MHQVNKKNQPLLTIAIPTYNRAKYLDLCLSKISEEISALNNDNREAVKVYISNNASTDDTEEIVHKFQKIIPVKFEYVTNQENIGGECNVIQCYLAANTPYIWVLGDDDVILPLGLQRVLDVLKFQQVDVMYLKNYWFKGEYKKKSVFFDAKRLTTYTDSLEFARRVNVMLTFISGQVVRVGIGHEYLSNVVHGSNLPQLAWVLTLLRDGKCFIVLENQIVAAKGGNSGGYELVNVFGGKLKDITESILLDKPKVARVIQSGTILNFFPGLIMSFRNGSSNFTDKDMADGLERAFGNNWRYRVFIYPLIKMPLFVSQCYYYIVRILAKFFGSVII